MILTLRFSNPIKHSHHQIICLASTKLLRAIFVCIIGQIKRNNYIEWMKCCSNQKPNTYFSITAKISFPFTFDCFKSLTNEICTQSAPCRTPNIHSKAFAELWNRESALTSFNATYQCPIRMWIVFFIISTVSSLFI